MPRISSGLLMFRRRAGRLEVLLVHPGGPFWTNRDLGAWTVPKGEVQDGEALLDCARREFEEELGASPGDGPFIELTPVKQKAGKIVHAWAIEGDFDPALLRSNSFPVEWPPKSGRFQHFPEVDRAEWFELPAAREKINAAQVAFLDELQRRLNETNP